jgi:hypothetical protein
MLIDVIDSPSFQQSMLLTIDALKIEFLVVDVFELNVLGARPNFEREKCNEAIV